MRYHVNDRVVHAAHGVGRVVGVVTKQFAAEARQYYEIAIERSTVWVPTEAGAGAELRLLTTKTELARYRAVLQSRPAALTSDHRQRRLDILNRMKSGSLQHLCEVIRDLTARSWRSPLNELDSAGLRKAREAVCREWAAAEGVPYTAAVQEVDALLMACRQKHVS